MTQERRIIVSLDEIKAFVFECNRCKSRVSIPPEAFEFIPENCPHGHSWQSAGLGHGGTFLKAIKHLKDPIYEKAGFRIFLEFEEPKN